MIIWPYKKFLIYSPSDISDFYKSLLRHTEKNASGYYWYRGEGVTFSGEVDSREFMVFKTVPYWNLSPLKITGTIVSDDPLIIRIKMINTFTLPVLISVFIVCILILINYWDDPPWEIPAGIMVLFYLAVNIPFQLESARAKKILLTISNGKTG